MIKYKKIFDVDIWCQKADKMKKKSRFGDGLTNLGHVSTVGISVLKNRKKWVTMLANVSHFARHDLQRSF